MRNSPQPKPRVRVSPFVALAVTTWQEDGSAEIFTLDDEGDVWKYRGGPGSQEPEGWKMLSGRRLKPGE